LICNAIDGDDEQEEKNGEDGEAFGGSRDDAVVPSENSQLIQSRNKIPTRGNVSSDEDADGQGREGVHRSIVDDGRPVNDIPKLLTESDGESLPRGC